MTDRKSDYKSSRLDSGSSESESIDYRPSCGGGSCASCQAPLGLDAMKKTVNSSLGAPEAAWYCSPGCAQGLPAAGRRQPVVAEARLYNRPQRFHRKRQPKELRKSSDA